MLDSGTDSRGLCSTPKVKTVQSGELSRLAGISTDTLRHYERLGVLPKPPRTNGGYRDPANSLERVRLIQSALKVGSFSLTVFLSASSTVCLLAYSKGVAFGLHQLAT
jgi:hypothetical protein